MTRDFLKNVVHAGKVLLGIFEAGFGQADGVLACFRALGEARDLLGAMADRLDPEATQ